MLIIKYCKSVNTFKYVTENKPSLLVLKVKKLAPDQFQLFNIRFRYSLESYSDTYFFLNLIYHIFIYAHNNLISFSLMLHQLHLCSYFIIIKEIV